MVHPVCGPFAALAWDSHSQLCGVLVLTSSKPGSRDATGCPTSHGAPTLFIGTLVRFLTKQSLRWSENSTIILLKEKRVCAYWWSSSSVSASVLHSPVAMASSAFRSAISFCKRTIICAGKSGRARVHLWPTQPRWQQTHSLGSYEALGYKMAQWLGDKPNKFNPWDPDTQWKKEVTPADCPLNSTFALSVYTWWIIN